MAKSFVVDVSEDLVNYIERLDYEATSYKDVIITLLEAHKGDPDATCIDNPVFKAYQEKYSKIKAEYDLAKNQITKEYIPECLKDHQVDWNLEYSSAKLTVTVKCECGEKILEDYLCKEE